MSKRILSALCAMAAVLALIPLTVPQAVAAETALPFTFGFTEAEMAALEAEEGLFETNENAEGGPVTGEVDHDGDGAAFKARHIPDTTYMSIPNGIRLTFGTPLPADTNYSISAWFYVPSEGNQDVDGKRVLLGPGILINGNAGDNEYKWPNSDATAGTVKYDEWKQVLFDTVPLGDEIAYIDFRFYTNDFGSHPEVWYLDDISISVFDTGEDTEIEVDLPSLKDAYADYFLLGTAGGVTGLTGKRFDLTLKHFNTFTYENEMKPNAVQNVEGVFNLEPLDRMTPVLKEHNLNIVGHTLLWHSQSPEWMWLDKDKALERLETHIETVMLHVGPDLMAIDVVNEAFTNDGGPGVWQDNLRTTEGWYTALGPEFIEIAFRKADEMRNVIGRPDLKLLYNDFNEDNPNKAQNIHDMVRDFQNRGVPIDGIGLQAHYNAQTKPEDIRRTIELLNTIPDIEVHITELDITIESSRGKPAMTEEEQLYQANMYAKLFEIFKDYAAGPANPYEDNRLITRVTFWGVTDNQSWRGDRYPLLFDKNNKAKAAFYAVLDPINYRALLAGEAPAAPPEAEGPAATEGPAETPAPTDAPAPAPTEAPSDDSGMPGWIIWVFIGAAVGIGAVLTIVVRAKKK